MSEERELHEEDSRWRKSGGNDRKETKAKTISIGRDEVWGYKASKREPEMYMTVKDVVTIGDRAVAKKEVDNVDDRGINNPRRRDTLLCYIQVFSPTFFNRSVMGNGMRVFHPRVSNGVGLPDPGCLLDL